jgi:predicted nucleic acid-binding protein
MILVDATTLIALGQVGELELLGCFGEIVYTPKIIIDEIYSEPAATNLKRSIEFDQITCFSGNLYRGEAMNLLGETERNGDVDLIAVVLAELDSPDETIMGGKKALISDDRRVRTVAQGLGVKVTGTIGVIVRAVAEGELDEEKAKRLVRRLDSHGLHMTGELREKADELIEQEAGKREK